MGTKPLLEEVYYLFVAYRGLQTCSVRLHLRAFYA